MNRHRASWGCLGNRQGLHVQPGRGGRVEAALSEIESSIPWMGVPRPFPWSERHRHERVHYRRALGTGRNPRAACAERNRSHPHRRCRAAGEHSVARRPCLEGFRPHGAGWNAPRDAFGPDGRRADARPRELRLRACGRARGQRQGAAALGDRCDPRMRSPGFVRSGAGLCRAPRLPLRPEEPRSSRLPHRLSSRPAVLVRSAPTRCSTTSISSMPHRPCLPRREHETRAGSSTPPTVGPSRSRISWMPSRIAWAGRGRCTFRCSRRSSPA